MTASPLDSRVEIVARIIARWEYRKSQFDGTRETEFVGDWWHLYVPHAREIVNTIPQFRFEKELVA